jgi:hypothetical protein
LKVKQGAVTIELTGKIYDMAIDFSTDKAILSLVLEDKEEAAKCFDELRNEEKLSIKISKYRKKRSLDSNSYFWLLCGKLAAKLKQNKEDIYRQLIKNIGNNFEVIPLKNCAVNKFIEAWNKNGIGWVCDVLGESKIEGYTNVCAYYGSSTYDSKQMSDLIDSVIFECKEQGIQTATPDELSKMLSLWKEEV